MTDTNNNTHIDTLELDPADGQQYVMELRDKLLDLLSPQQTIEDVEDRMRKLYPGSKLVDLAIGAASKPRTETLKHHKIRHHSTSGSFTGALQNFTSLVAKVNNLWAPREGKSDEVSKFKMSLIEYIIDDVLNLAGDFVKRQKGNFIITRSDIRTAMHADKDLLDMFLSDDKSLLAMKSHPLLAQLDYVDKTSPYNHHLHGYNNAQVCQELSTISYKQKVRNMVDSENSFIRHLKMIIKVFKAQFEKAPLHRREIDMIFCNIEELQELSILLLTAFEDSLDSVGQEENETPFVGSEILDLAQAEEFHAYYKVADSRLSEQWKKSYINVIDNEVVMDSFRRVAPSYELAVKHLLPHYLLNSIVQFFEYFKNFSELYELSKRHENRRDESALKETLSILIKTKKAIEDLLQTESAKDEIGTLDAKQVESLEEMLRKKLESELKIERNMPLHFMPPPEIYRFSEPDSEDNIQFEDSKSKCTLYGKDIDKNSANETDQIPVIKCATLIKLVERLTYHKYQPNIVDSFLVTYRSFMSNPEELLDLLIERYKIPDPPLFTVFPNFTGSLDELSEADRTYYKHYLKRFRQEYSKPVKMRVINVLKSWIKNHYYDFERHPTLLKKLHAFLGEILNNDKILGSLVISIKKLIAQKQTSQREGIEFMLPKEPPHIVWWTAKANEPEKFDILTLHPVEFARQLTLVEFDLFRAIKPSELINVREFETIKTREEDKYEWSPNLNRMTRHFTLLSYWIRKCIVEAEDFDKRSAIYSRAIEIMGVLREFNNFTGLLSIGSAIESAPISRLTHTKKTLAGITLKILEDYRELNDDHQKKLKYELRNCNPPCIPYLGSYQTMLIHAKEGNRTFIEEVDKTSPTLSNDDFQISPFSNSPSTPISPRTPLPRSAIQNLNSATPKQNQFFGGGTLPMRSTMPRPLPINLSNISNTNTVIGSNGKSSFGTMTFCGGLMPPLTPGPPKMINFTKQRIRAGLVAEISNYQNPPYCLRVQSDIRQYIESIEYKMTKFAATLAGSDSSGPLENSVPAMTKRLDDYLFEQSERIEPKNCTKPQVRSKSKLPDSWKSPGIKLNNCATLK